MGADPLQAELREQVPAEERPELDPQRKVGPKWLDPTQKVCPMGSTLEWEPWTTLEPGAVQPPKASDDEFEPEE